MRVYLEKRVVLGLIVALAVLAGLSVMIFTNNKELADGRLIVFHLNEVPYHSEQLLAAIVDAETGQRGYAITGDDLLQPYHQSLSSIDKHFETLVKLTADNPLDQAETVFFVRYYEVGFGMQFVDKLFAVFQRLHKMQDFRGTGVGLAIVKRIIGRHSGRVWTVSALGVGASFYFSTPQS